ncbi:unnamed protein product, partial [Cladocopium goreaui]
QLAIAINSLDSKVDLLITKVEQLTLRLEVLEQALERPRVAAPSESAVSAAGSKSSQYDGLAEQIPPLPGWVLDLCVSLQDCSLTKRERAERAWESGTWARFVLEGQIGVPRPSKPIELPNKIYVVLRAPGYSCPLFCESAATYRAVVREFKGTLSHGFPSRTEQNPAAVYLLNVISEEAEDVCTCHALVLMKREGGVLLALPAGALPMDTLQAAVEADPFTMYGPHIQTSIRLMGPGVDTESEDVEVLVIDADGAVLAHLMPLPDPVPDNFVSFGPDPAQLPEFNGLLQFTREWIAGMQDEQTMAFYSAVEEPQQNGQGDPASPTATAGPKAATKQKAKRTTTTALADQLAQVADVLPQLTKQIMALQRDQEEMRSQMVLQSQAVPPRASQVPVSAPLRSFAKMMGSPPRTKVKMSPPLGAAEKETQEEGLPLEDAEGQLSPGGGFLAQAVLEQSKALTNLVSQLQTGGDPLLDGQAGPSNIALGSRGAQGREKLQMELSTRSGGFFLAVLQNAFKRMRPAAKIPVSIAAAQEMDISMVTYLEKFGGYGQSREMGLVQYCLAHIFDNALQNDMDGVREHIALLMTAVEQAVQDGNKWELAYQLTLLEEPPSQMWAYRHSITQTRLRAFAPLCPQRWATVALAYAKEVDFIQNRKNEMNKRSTPSQPSQEGKEEMQTAGKKKRTAKSGREDGYHDRALTERAPWPDSDEGQKESHAPGPEFDASSLEGVPISVWTNGHIRRILRSRTTFSLYLLRSFTLCRERSSSLATALFPIPVPFLGVWDCGLKKMNAAARRLAAKRKLLHVAVMALNFMHDRAPLKSLGLLQRRPALHHIAVYERLMTIIKASVLSEVATIARCGRKSHQLDARIHELYKVLVDEGLTEKSKYHQLSSEAPVDLCNDKAEELRPYRSLDASRLKITGQGQWDCRPFMGSLLYMPFVEPRFNEYDIVPPDDMCPDVRHEDPYEVDKLAKVWDAKGQNFREGRLGHGPSHDLLTGVSLLQIMPKRFEEGLKGYVTDRRDFYHQFQATWERSLTNVVYPLRPLSGFRELDAFERCLEVFGKKRRKHDRFMSGDFLHGKRRSILVEEGSKVAVSFGSLFQGDHLGVEFACDAHQNLLLHYGLLNPTCRLTASQAILDDTVVEGLVIDDYFVVAKHVLGEALKTCGGHERLVQAKAAYEEQNIYGSDDKDVWGEKVFKVVGAEIDARDELVRKGAVLCGVPADKRMALASVSALVCSWPCTSDSLHPSIVGSLVSALMFRRPLMAILNEVFHVIPAHELDPLRPVLRKLPRKAAQEFALAAALCPIMVSNLAVDVDSKLYATDASNSMGGIASTEVPDHVARFLWRTADKKGANIPILSRIQALIATYEEAPEDSHLMLQPGGDCEQVPRPIGLRFDFIEVFGGAGVVTKYLCQMNVVCAPVMDISFSLQYDLMDVRVVEWLIFMLESKRIHAVLLAPPCTTFSPAAYPPCRSYENPLGFNRSEFKVYHGTKLAHASLCIMFTTMRTDSLGLLEQPRRSKMRWLATWKRLVEMGMEEHFLASCSFGSIHMKEFCFAAVNMQAESLDRPCTRDHNHIKIEGKFTRPSATYVDGLAYELACVFKRNLDAMHKALQATEVAVEGLEDPVSNDVALAYEWKVEDSWRWKGSSHINVLETASTLRLMRRLARGGGDVRATYLGDSHVSRSCMAKGRLMPADHPSRGASIPPPVPASIVKCRDSRQAARAGIELGDGRRTTEATAAARTDLLSVLCNWLAERETAFEDLFLANPPDLDKINQVLTEYGRWLFKKGKPYYHYSETINAVSSRRPILRRALQQAWDLAFMWGSYEPTEHHVGMPFQILLAVLSTMLIWGWTREAACMALAWGSLLRIGEVLNATRKDLILPDDVAGSISYTLLRIKEPKTRFRAARHQAGKMEQPDLISVVQLGFAKLKNSEPLWHLPGATLRHRLEKVLAALGLPYRSGQKPKALTLASLSAGGATWLITATESADLVKRRGRWASHRIMEIYLQEVSAATYLNDLDRHVRQQVLEAMELFPEVLQNA